ncbi:apolipoprotein L3-like [Dama dama]
MRKEVEALHEFLNELKTDLAMEDQERFQQDLLDRERFLKEFPQVKKEPEESIRKLYALADRVDKLHRDCTLFKVVANSTGTVSGVLNILGLALAPVTAGASLAVWTTGPGSGNDQKGPDLCWRLCRNLLLVGVGFLVKESMHLHEGAKTELAEKLRQQARELEKKLKQVIQTYERLKEGLTAPPPEQCRNEGHM